MNVTRDSDNAQEQALCELVSRYQTELLRMCYLYLRDQSLAEDAVQETFLKAYTSMHAFRGECSEKTWLMRIAINTCRDMRRSGWFRHIDHSIRPENLPEASAPFEESDESLTLAIMRLPHGCRQAVLLHYYQNMSVEETAKALNVSASTVSTQLTRARRKLRAMLEGGHLHE